MSLHPITQRKHDFDYKAYIGFKFKESIIGIILSNKTFKPMTVIEVNYYKHNIPSIFELCILLQTLQNTDHCFCCSFFVPSFVLEDFSSFYIEHLPTFLTIDKRQLRLSVLVSAWFSTMKFS